MVQAQGVANFVGRQLPDARQRQLLHLVRNGLAVLIGLQKAFGDEVVLAVPVGPERHDALDDFAGARVDVGVAVGECPRRAGAVYPVHHVVANVHGVGPIWQFFNLKGVGVARRLKGLVPPRTALNQGFFDSGRRAPVHVVNDGPHGLAAGGRGVLFFESVANRESLRQRLIDGRGKIQVAKLEEAGARVEFAGVKPMVGQLNEGLVHLHRHRVRVGREAGLVVAAATAAAD